MHFFLFIFLAVIHTANGTAKTLLEVNGTKISERVFRDYAEYLYKDEYFLVHNTKLKKEMVIDNIINNVLTSQKLMKQQRIDYSKDELNALSHIIHGSFFKKKVKLTAKLQEDLKQPLPKTIINYFKIVFTDKVKATATLNELKNNFKTLKNQLHQGIGRTHGLGSHRGL